MQTSNSTKINRIRMPPGGDASFGVSICMISESCIIVLLAYKIHIDSFFQWYGLRVYLHL